MKEILNFKINKIIRDQTKTAKRDYLQVYFDIIDADGMIIHNNGSFFVNSNRMSKWIDRFESIIESRDDTRIKELEEELKKLRESKKRK